MENDFWKEDILFDKNGKRPSNEQTLSNFFGKSKPKNDVNNAILDDRKKSNELVVNNVRIPSPYNNVNDDSKEINDDLIYRFIKFNKLDKSFKKVKYFELDNDTTSKIIEENNSESNDPNTNNKNDINMERKNDSESNIPTNMDIIKDIEFSLEPKKQNILINDINDESNSDMDID